MNPGMPRLHLLENEINLLLHLNPSSHEDLLNEFQQVVDLSHVEEAVYQLKTSFFFLYKLYFQHRLHSERQHVLPVFCLVVVVVVVVL